MLKDHRLPTAALAFASQAGWHLQAGAKGRLPPEVDCNGDVSAVDLVPPALWYKHCVTCLHHSVQCQCGEWDELIVNSQCKLMQQTRVQ